MRTLCLCLCLSLSLFILRHKVSWCTEGVQSDRDGSIVAFVVLRIQMQIHVCTYREEQKGPPASQELINTQKILEHINSSNPHPSKAVFGHEYRSVRLYSIFLSLLKGVQAFLVRLSLVTITAILFAIIRSFIRHLQYVRFVFLSQFVHVVR